MNSIINSLQARIEKTDRLYLSLQEQELNFWKTRCYTRETSAELLALHEKRSIVQNMQRQLRQAMSLLLDVAYVYTQESINV